VNAWPRVSVVMPTFNRRDTILRAIDSVRAQTLEDWELLVVDDGSTDGTKDAVVGLDRRLRLIVQDNTGVAGARNAALASARGQLIAFLDSDDAWTPHHLALASAFFEQHPDEHAFTSEFWERFGDGAPVVHPKVEMGDWYPETARRLGSTAFASPPREGDPYLWFYEAREPVGAWAEAALAKTPYRSASRYRGDLFQKWRWGWLMALQPTVVTRHALEVVGLMDRQVPVASDFKWLAGLCRQFPMNFVSAPGAIKHEYADGAQRALSEGHLVTGKTATQFHLDVLRCHEELFWQHAPADPELAALRGFRQALVARAALKQGRRALAREHLEQAVRTLPGLGPRALLWLARLPQDRVASALYRGSLQAARLSRGVARAVQHLRQEEAP
jgi:hypothetical protein